MSAFFLIFWNILITLALSFLCQCQTLSLSAILFNNTKQFMFHLNFLDATQSLVCICPYLYKAVYGRLTMSFSAGHSFLCFHLSLSIQNSLCYTFDIQIISNPYITFYYLFELITKTYRKVDRRKQANGMKRALITDYPQNYISSLDCMINLTI